jgi:hypothetical protein
VERIEKVLAFNVAKVWDNKKAQSIHTPIKFILTDLVSQELIWQMGTLEVRQKVWKRWLISVQGVVSVLNTNLVLLYSPLTVWFLK